MKLSDDLRRVMRDSVRSYFAPLTGAIRGVRAELARVDRDAQRHRDLQEQREHRSSRTA